MILKLKLLSSEVISFQLASRCTFVRCAQNNLSNKFIYQNNSDMIYELIDEVR